jgi:hypothetical protein
MLDRSERSREAFARAKSSLARGSRTERMMVRDDARK